MNKDQFSEQIHQIKTRLLDFENQNQQAVSQSINKESTSEDIQILIEELNVAIEELYEQNSELQETRNILESERQRYKELFDFAPNGYLITDSYGTIREANEAAGKLLNVLSNNLIGKPFQVFVAESDVAGFRKFLSSRDLSNERDSFEKEVRLQPRDAASITVNLTMRVSPAQDEVKIRWMLQDVTERYELTKALSAVNENLEERVHERTSELIRINQELHDFAFTASHDMQEPLRKVTAFAALLKDRYSSLLPEEGNDYLDRIMRANERMNDMLQGLLSVSRVTTRAEPFQSIDLNHIIEGVIFDLELPIEQAHAHIEIEKLPELEADPNQLRQLFQNLLSNAIKFHESGKPPHVRVWSEKSSEDVTLMIKDDGIGFDGSYAEQIFQPFRRLNSPAAYRGSGMGLTICKKIIERHHGEIRAESTPGDGTTFYVTLPIRQPEEVFR